MSEKDVVLFLEDNLKRVPCGDYFSDCPWGVEENKQLFIAIAQFNDGNAIKTKDSEMKIYEVVDCTDEERYYTLGLFTDLDEAMATLEATIDPNELGSPLSQDEYFEVEIRERVGGWGDEGKLVYRRGWTWVFDNDDDDDNGRWDSLVLLDRRGYTYE